MDLQPKVFGWEKAAFSKNKIKKSKNIHKSLLDEGVSCICLPVQLRTWL